MERLRLSHHRKLLGLKRKRFLDDERRRRGKCWFRIFLNPNLWVWLNAKMMCKRRSLTMWMHMNDRCRTYIGRWKGTWCGDYLRAENHFVLLSLFSNLFASIFIMKSPHEVSSWSRIIFWPHTVRRNLFYLNLFQSALMQSDAAWTQSVATHNHLNQI